MAFVGMVMLQNLRALLHDNNLINMQGYVVMTPFGKYMGGHLLVCRWAIQHTREYQPGNIVIFNSGILPHAITLHGGTRHTVVLFVHKKVFDHEG